MGVDGTKPVRRSHVAELDHDETVDYDFSRLGALEFEHMIQALAIAELGISVTTFGAGKDGGREATFSGKVTAPNDENLTHWDGYGIVQAKTIRFLSEEKNDAKSVAAAVKTELDAFVARNGEDPARDNPPKYYLLATNVRLSPVEETGGIDVVAKVLREHPVKLSNFAIWHYEHLCRLLDKNEGIRRTFAAFITPGDVLSRMMDVLGGSSRDLGSVLQLNAAKQIAVRETLKLETGEITDTAKVRLSDIAIDLPSRVTAMDTHVMTVQHILQRGDHSLRNSHALDEAYAFVVIGGPGQGKSTIGQIVAQAYRVALLEDVSTSITPAIDRALVETKRRLEEVGLPVPRNKRWPIVLDAASFADSLLENPELTVIEYAAKQLRDQSAEIATHQLASWLAIWPWALVLDGLDEVPARASRGAVVTAINDLITESRMQNWDLLIIGTTRPLGYENEFAELNPEELELKALTPDEGFVYGKKIAETKLAGDPEAIDTVTAHLKEASLQAHSRRLMTTPLQVSIMEFLLEELAEVPSTRHELFDGYYKAIYARESKKAGYLGRLLKKHREEVEWVHQRVAAGLQVQSEGNGEALSALPEADITLFFRDQLEERGYAEAKITQLSDDLDKATKQRLVLLVPRGEDQITFEVRSLQEYMAARWITAGDLDLVLDRLRALAPSAYWRNAWLLSAGRLYTSRPQDRDTFLERLRQWDNESVVAAFLGLGARMALELLEDDFAMAVPRHYRSLLELAMTSLNRWNGVDTKRLTKITRQAISGDDEMARQIVVSKLEEGVSSGSRAHLGAIAILQRWEKDHDKVGALARTLLQNVNWHPDDDKLRMQNLMKAPAGDALAEYIDPAATALSPGLELWPAAKDLMNEVDVQVNDASPSETFGYSYRDLPSKALGAEVFAYPAVQTIMVHAANAVPISRAPIAIIARRLLLAADESLPRGEAARLFERLGTGFAG